MSQRDNSKRLSTPEATPPPPAPPQEVPQFNNFTNAVELPSGGSYYDEGNPLRSGEVEIYYMTAKHEDILTNKKLLKQGKMIDRLIGSLLVDKSIDLSTMLSGDKNALLIAARIDAYGEEYKLEFICPACEVKSKHVFNLSEEVVHIGGKSLLDDFTRLENGDVEMKLPKCGVTIVASMATGLDEVAIFELNKNRKKAQMEEMSLVDQMNMFIKSVDGNEDPGVINQFVERCPASDSRHFRRMYKKATPATQLVKNFQCPSCSFNMDREVAFNAEFFWPQ